MFLGLTLRILQRGIKIKYAEGLQAHQPSRAVLARGGRAAFLSEINERKHLLIPWVCGHCARRADCISFVDSHNTSHQASHPIFQGWGLTCRESR